VDNELTSSRWLTSQSKTPRVMKETQSAMTVEINFESIKISTDEWLKNTIMVADDPLI